MKNKSSSVFWLIFIVIMLGGYVFMIFFMEDITSQWFGVKEKKIHLTATTLAGEVTDKNASVTIGKASKTILRDSTVIVEGKKAIIKKDTGISLGGFKLFLVNLFNNSRVVFSILIVLTIVILGWTVGFSIDSILRIFGMDVSKISHHE